MGWKPNSRTVPAGEPIDFTCDTVADVTNLPRGSNIPSGSTCLCIDGTRVFILSVGEPGDAPESRIWEEL